MNDFVDKILGTILVVLLTVAFAKSGPRVHVSAGEFVDSAAGTLALRAVDVNVR